MALEAPFREIFEHIILDTPLDAVVACCSYYIPTSYPHLVDLLTILYSILPIHL